MSGKYENSRASGRAKMKAEFQKIQGSSKPSGKKQQSRDRSMKILLAVLAGVVLVAGIGAGALLISYGRDDGLIFQNVYVLGVNVGGMDRQQAQEVLQERADTVFGEPLTVKFQDRMLILTPEGTKVQPDVPALVEAAVGYGREGNMFDRAKARTEAALSTHEIDCIDLLHLDTSYIHDAVNQLGESLESEFRQWELNLTGTRPDLTPYTLPDAEEEPGEETQPTEPTEPIIPPNGQTLTIVKGSAGRHLDTEKLYAQIIDAYNTGNLEVITASYDEKLPDPIDLEGFFQENCLAPVDAELDETTYKASKESLGYGFLVAEVSKQLEQLEEGKTLEVPFQVLIPQMTKANLEANLFRDVLSTCQTRHTWDNDRTTNLILACEQINGTILKPGAEFSFNDVVGKRTREKGYREAGVYVGRDTANQLGGGICQVASTLYYCSLYADLEIVERAQHTFEVDYVPEGLDATIYWGSFDYRFKNNTAYPIRIDATVHDGYVDVSFVGTDTKDYYIEMESDVYEWDSYETVEKVITEDMEDYSKYEEYEDGDVIVTGHSGYKVDTYRCKYDKKTDQLLSREFEAHSDFDRRDKVVAVVGREEPTEPPTVPTEPPTEPPTVPPTEETQPEETETP